MGFDKVALARVGQLNQTIGYDVKAFGAKGDGITDDTAAILNAISYASTSLIKKIIIQNGTYLIDVTDDVGGYVFQIPSGFTIEMGNEAYIQVIPNNLGEYAVFSLAHANNVTIRGGNIVGDRTTHTGVTGEWGFGIIVRSSDNVLIENVKVSNCWGDGVAIAYNHGEYNTNGHIDPTPNTNITLRRVVSDNNRRQGLTIGSGENISILNCTFSNTNGTPPQCGIDGEPNAGKPTIKNLIISQCLFHNNANDDIVLGLCEGVQILNCRCTNSVNGIEIQPSCTKVKIFGNEVGNMSGHGILTMSPETKMDLNNIHDIGSSYGMYVIGAGSSITRNTLKNIAAMGLHVGADNLKIHGNTFDTITTQAIYGTISAGLLTKLDIKDNEFTGVAQSCIYGKFASGTIQGNRFDSATQGTAYMMDSINNIFEGNFFTNAIVNSACFITFNGTSGLNKITNNTFLGAGTQVAYLVQDPAASVGASHVVGNFATYVTQANIAVIFPTNIVDVIENNYGSGLGLIGSVTWDPGSLADGVGETSAAITVTGAAFGDYVRVGNPYDLQGVTCSGYVSAANTVRIRLQNETTGTIDFASGLWKVKVIKI